jgi:hypothetical protein
MPEARLASAGAVRGNVFYVAGGTALPVPTFSPTNSEMKLGDAKLWGYTVQTDTWAQGAACVLA